MLLASVIIDTFKFIKNLYYPNLKLINESDEYLNKETNLIMDGSISKKKMEQSQMNASFSELSRRLTTKSNRLVKKFNPLKEGLSLTTMGILKVTLIHLLKKHLRLVNEVGINGKAKFFVPVKYIIYRMRVNLMIEEQLNTILYGITYRKKNDFFRSQDFQVLVDGSDQAIFEKESDMDDDHRENISNQELWRRKLEGFLMRSQEQWLLDQFNLVKHFLLRNSWEADEQENEAMQSVTHPVYKHYNQTAKRTNRIPSAWSVEPKRSIQTPKKNKKNKHKKREEMEEYSSSEEESKEIEKRQMGTYDTEDRKEDGESEPDMTSFSTHKVQKIDISALVQTIEEIENRLRMATILKSSRFLEENNHKELDDYYEDFLTSQFSILNFKRNFESIRAQQNDETL